MISDFIHALNKDFTYNLVLIQFYYILSNPP